MCTMLRCSSTFWMMVTWRAAIGPVPTVALLWPSWLKRNQVNMDHYKCKSLIVFLIWNVWLGIPQFMQKDCVALDMVVFTACCGCSGVVGLALGCATMFTSSKVLVVWSLKLCHKHLLGWQLWFSIDCMDYHHSSCNNCMLCKSGNYHLLLWQCTSEQPGDLFCGGLTGQLGTACMLIYITIYIYIHLHTYM